MSRLEVWAPTTTRVTVRVDREGAEPASVALTRLDRGLWQADVAELVPGADYRLHLAADPADGGAPGDGTADGDGLPDPRAVWQPEGVHGPSRWYDHGAFAWTDAQWRGAPLAGAVIYECHIGTFTPEGTFDAALGRLDHLVDLGITHLELLPCNTFDGRWGWGYDGVGWCAVFEPYGGPDGLKRLVDGCHARGLGVIMDAVYNHLGPAGNYLPRFGPYLTSGATPWGETINLDGSGSDEVRRLILDSALGWLRDFHCDGLRLDAVHALADSRALPILPELSARVAALGAQLRRPLFLIGESDRNDPATVAPVQAGGAGLDGQWCDDVHHALWTALSGERQGYYADFGPLPVLAKALTSAFVHDGTWSSFRGRSHGRPVDRERTPGWRFVTYLSNHDQVGNRATGDRPSATLSPGLLRIGAALVLLSPFTPMIFMGEEWGASTPWQFFSDHSGDLGDAVREGRRAEFADHGWAGETVPDPQDPATRDRSRLDWSEPGTGAHAELLDWYRRLIALRQSQPAFSDGRLDRTECTVDDAARWLVLRRGDLVVAANLAPRRQQVPLGGNPVEVLAASIPGFTYTPGSVDLDGESVVVLRLVG